MADLNAELDRYKNMYGELEKKDKVMKEKKKAEKKKAKALVKAMKCKHA